MIGSVSRRYLSPANHALLTGSNTDNFGVELRKSRIAGQPSQLGAAVACSTWGSRKWQLLHQSMQNVTCRLAEYFSVQLTQFE
jgi:hypothetical protein